MENSGQYKKQFLSLLTKEALEKAYAQYGNLKDVGKFFGVSGGCIKSYMILHNLPFKKKIIYTCDDTVFSKDTESSFYWAGFMAADGNVSKQNDIGLTLATKDIDQIIKFKEYLKSDSPVTTVQKPARKILGADTGPTLSSRFRIRSNKIAKDLEKFNIIPNKTKVYDIPDWVINHEYFKHFLRGYFEGDGWYSETITKKTQKKKLTWGLCGNKWVMEKIKNKLETLLDVSVSMYKHKNLWRLNIQNQHSVYLISDFIYHDANVFLSRKKILADSSKTYDENTIILNFSKEKLEEAYVRLGSVKMMAEEFDCCKNSIYNYFKKVGINV